MSVARSVAWLLAGAVLTAAAPVPVSAPIHFRGDVLDARKAQGVLRLLGHARVEHAKTVIEAEKIEILYGDDQKTIDRMIAEGNVRLQEPNRRGRADRAAYYPATRKLVLTGRPSIWEDGDQLSGEQIVLYKEPDRLEVTQAQAVVQPERVQAAMDAAGPTTPTTAAEDGELP